MHQWQATATAYGLQSLSMASNLLSANPALQTTRNAQQLFPNLTMQLAAAAITGAPTASCLPAAWSPCRATCTPHVGVAACRAAPVDLAACRAAPCSGPTSRWHLR
jgi:hypothetical protein